MSGEDWSTRGDDDLRARVRRADPAAGLPPLDDDARRRLVDGLLDSPVDGSAGGAGGGRAGRRRWLAAAAGAAAAGVLVAVAAGVLLGPTGPTGTTEVVAGGAPPGAPAAACTPATTEDLAASDLAAAATVVTVEDARVELETTERFAGEVADVVVLLPAEGGAGGVVVDGVPGPLEEGQVYLLAASDGVLRGCGLSGPDAPALRELYARAFAGG